MMLMQLPLHPMALIMIILTMMMMIVMRMMMTTMLKLMMRMTMRVMMMRKILMLKAHPHDLRAESCAARSQRLEHGPGSKTASLRQLASSMSTWHC